MTSIFNLPLLMVFICLAGVALYTKIWKVGQWLNMELVTCSSALAGIGLFHWLSLQGNLAIEVTGDALGMGNLLLASAPFLFGRWLFPNREATETQLKQWHCYEQLPVGVLLIGAHRKILFSNTKARQILQRQETELLGNQAFAEDWQVVEADGTPFTEVTRLLQPVKDMVLGVLDSKTGQRIWLQVNTQPLDGNHQQVICTFSDISRYQQCELALGEVQSRLEKQSHALVALAVNTLDSGDLQSSFQELTAAAACTLGIERVGIWLYNRNCSEISLH